MDNLINLRKQSEDKNGTPPAPGVLSHPSAIDTPSVATQPLAQSVEAQVGDIPMAMIAPQPIHRPTPTSHDSTPHETDLRWSGTLYNHNPHMPRVFALVGVLFGAAVLIYFWQSNLIASILFVLLGCMLLMHVRKDKEIFDFEVSHAGVHVNDDIYKYHEIESFWIDYHPQFHIKELSLHLRKRYLPYVKIPLYDMHPVQVREIMIDFIPEIHHPASLADVLSRKLGI